MGDSDLSSLLLLFQKQVYGPVGRGGGFYYVSSRQSNKLEGFWSYDVESHQKPIRV